MRNNRPQEIIVDGKPMMAVAVKEFESLLATRRQLGSQTARLRMLRDTLVDMTEFLDTLVEALDDDTPPRTPSSGPADTRPELVTEIRRRAHQMRAITGAGRTGRGGRSPERPRT
ncbi:hypothetical protein [Streptomyces alboflavus]|uniref:hypothetical protein n=1 Tax=Streptomyces alboflavus TaxID=67267 RepID=UPI0004C18046|nr:hypothetical protein [Streptomyces alboflavus]